MKVAIITDQHFGMRKGSKIFHDFIGKFYNDTFFPYLEENNIDTVLDLGDTFDNRRNIDLWSLEWAKNNYFSRLEKMGITVHTIVGNHTAYYKNTNKINTIDLLLQQYNNLITYDSPTDVTIGGLKILFVPWINEENRIETESLLKKSKATVCMGHLELAGFEAHPGYSHINGDSVDKYKRFKKVFSGHYHTKSTKGNVTYLGNPYQIYWNDYGDRRGFHEFDTETLDLKYIKNPYTIFNKVMYDDNTYNTTEDFDEFQDQYVKIIVQEKNNYLTFDKFVEGVYHGGAHDVKIIENFDLNAEEDDWVEVEDTLTTLEKYVDDIDTEMDKSNIKSIIKNLYREASQV